MCSQCGQCKNPDGKAEVRSGGWEGDVRDANILILESRVSKDEVSS